MLIIPCRVNVHSDRTPVANLSLIGITCLAFLFFTGVSPEAQKPLVLTNLASVGLFGHLFVHAGWLHLVGNMIFLLVFGNALCSRLGDGKFLAVYFLSGLGAAIAHLAISGHPAVGASGAISGVVGCYAVLFPWKKVDCKWFFGYGMRFRSGEIQVAGLWLVALWVVEDVMSGMLIEDGVAHWAHLGGYAAGAGLAVALIMLKAFEFNEHDEPMIGKDQVPEKAELIVSEAAQLRGPRFPVDREVLAPLSVPEGPLKLTAEEKRELRKKQRTRRKRQRKEAEKAGKALQRGEHRPRVVKSWEVNRAAKP